jgi:hypothetical protein
MEDEEPLDLIREVVDVKLQTLTDDRIYRHDTAMYGDEIKINSQIRNKYRRYRSKLNYAIYLKRKQLINIEMAGKNTAKHEVDVGRPKFSESSTMLEIDSHDFYAIGSGLYTTLKANFYYDVQYNDIVINYKMHNSQTTKEASITFELDELEIDTRDIDEIKEEISSKVTANLGLDPRDNLVSRHKFERVNKKDSTGWRSLFLKTATSAGESKAQPLGGESEDDDEVSVESAKPVYADKLLGLYIPRMRSYPLKRKAEVLLTYSRGWSSL